MIVPLRAPLRAWLHVRLRFFWRCGFPPGLLESLGAQGFLVRFFIFIRIRAEIVVFPDVFVEGSLIDGAGIEDDVVTKGRERCAREVGAGDLQSVEREAGGFAVELAGDGEAQDLHDADLDRVGVLKGGKVDGDAAAAARAVGVELDALLVMAFVEEAETVAAQGGRSALRAVDLEILAPIWERKHG